MRKLLIPILLLLVACNAERRFNDYAIKNPEKFKQLAAVLAPSFTGKAKSDTVITTRSDTVTIAGVSDTVTINDTVRITKYLPGQRIEHNREITIHDTIPDTRSLAACASLNKELTEKLIVVDIKLQESLKTSKTRLWWIIGIIGAIAVYFGFKIWGGKLFGVVRKVVGL